MSEQTSAVLFAARPLLLSPLAWALTCEYFFLNLSSRAARTLAALQTRTSDMLAYILTSTACVLYLAFAGVVGMFAPEEIDVLEKDPFYAYSEFFVQHVALGQLAYQVRLTATTGCGCVGSLTGVTSVSRIVCVCAMFGSRIRRGTLPHAWHSPTCARWRCSCITRSPLQSRCCVCIRFFTVSVSSFLASWS